MNRKLGRLLTPSPGLFFVLLMAFAAAAAVMQSYLLAAAEFAVTALALIIYLVSHRKRKRQLQKYISHCLENVTEDGEARPPFPMVTIRLSDGVVLYANDSFVRLTGFHDTMVDRELGEVIPGFSAAWLGEGKTQYPYDVTMGKHRYRVYGTTIYANDPAASRLGVLYFSDLTELYQVRDEYIRSRPVVSVVLIDNYDELTKNLSEGTISALNARLNNAITQWVEPYGGLLRRLEKNRFLLIFEKRYLNSMIERKFRILEDIHEITNPSALAASLSIGMGLDAESYTEGYEFASLAIEMALSRGGDQVVTKDRLSFKFYGGRSKESDHRSKVRSRITAGSLMELIGQSSQVFVMGHKNADMDAVGAATGICCMCRKKGKNARIVLDLEENMAPELIEQIRAVPEYAGVFISGQEALLAADNKTTLVVVDTNRPDQVENSQLLEAVSSICVIDHHRRAADYITPVVVNLHETTASSASELVTELLEYAVEKKDVLPIEAMALMAGIYLDTKSFHIRTGECTFEAAAYLRQLGADTVEVKKLLQNNFHDTILKYQIIQAARLYLQKIAIAVLDQETTRPLAAQAADDLLNISGVCGSFVLFPSGNDVFISGRALDELNAQMVLEPLGGGGNAASAGAYMKNTTTKQALDALLLSINQFYKIN